jgi:transposase InsO family protein
MSAVVRRSIPRYEKTRPGELLHLDLKYLPVLNHPRPEYEFAAIDDYIREAVAQITADRTSRVATDFLEQVLAKLPYRVEAVMTDNDLAFTMRFAFHSNRQTRLQQACRSWGIQHRLIRPHTPASNGKVERFIKTIDDECYAIHRPRSSKTRRRVSVASSCGQNAAIPANLSTWPQFKMSHYLSHSTIDFRF